MALHKIRLLLSGALVFACACASGEWHESLRQQHLDARGGHAALESLQVIERTGTITFHELSPEVSGTYHTCIHYPTRVVIDIDAGPVQVHQVRGDSGALECGPGFDTCAVAHEDVAEQLEVTAQEANREELRENIPKDAVIEPIRRDERIVGYRYEIDGELIEKEYSPESRLLLRTRKGPRERRYSNWRDVGGLLMPMLIEDLVDGKRAVTVELSSATHDVTPGKWCRTRFASRST
jgi:hypothetical protein